MLVRCLILSSTLADFLTRENREQGKEIQNSICRSGRDSTQHCYTRGEKEKNQRATEQSGINSPRATIWRMTKIVPYGKEQRFGSRLQPWTLQHSLYRASTEKRLSSTRRAHKDCLRGDQSASSCSLIHLTLHSRHFYSTELNPYLKYEALSPVLHLQQEIFCDKYSSLMYFHI